jgi:hypothetical protein
MNIYKGLLFLEGFRVLPEHVDDVADPAAPVAERPESRAPVARSGWRRAAYAVAAFAGVVPAVNPQGRCG